MPSTWTPEAEARLFRGVLEIMDIRFTGNHYNQLSAFMDNEFSAEAIRQRIQKKIRKSTGNATAAAAAAGPSTPKATKKKSAKTDAAADDTETPGKANRSRKRAGKAKAEEAAPEEDDRTIPETPVKKLKLEDDDKEGDDL